MKNKLLHLAAAALLTGGTALAGSFTNSFTNPNNTTGFTIQGSGTLADGSSWQPVITPSGMILATNQGSLGGTLVIADLDSQQAIQSFTAKFQILLDGAADGVSFVFGPDITDGTAVFGETGPGMSSGGLAVSFDLYNNGAPDFIGISTYLLGVEYGTNAMALSDTAWKDVSIQLNRNGTLNMTYGGQVIYTNFALPGYVDVSGQFGFGARTGGAFANQGIRNLGISTTLKGADVAASITSQPASVTINEKETATFEVGFDGTPPFTFQWSKNGADLPDGTSNVLTLTNVLAADNGAKFKCTVVNALKTVTTAEAILTVKSDTVAPTVLSATGSLDLAHVTLVFSKQLTTASAESTGNYKIDQSLTVTAATLNTNDLKTVVLTTSGQKPATTYTITINGVKDTTTAGNTIATDTKVTFLSESLKVVGVGAMQKSGNTGYDVGVSYNLPYDKASGTTLANYTLSGGTASAITGFSSGVVLSVSGLQADTTYTIAVANVKDSAGNTIVAVTNSFKVSKMQWGVVGGDQLNLGNGVVTVGDKGFDIYSDGFGEWNNYDESTFVYEKVTGDFDKKVRVEYQDLSSEWARAGLVMREVTNFGVDAIAQTGDPSGTSSNATGTPPYPGVAGRYQKIHVNPVGPTLTGPGTAGNQSWEGNRRLDVGGPSSTALTGANAIPQYPNAWCRLQRKDQTFTIFRSDDGVNWVNLGSTTWPDSADPSSTPMPATVYVGPEYSPENGNITDTASYGVWLAKFRDYGDTATAASPASITLTRSGNSITIQWSPAGGTLESTPTLGPTAKWTAVGTANPATITIGASPSFYRVKN